jgi:peptidoglycan/LPS O-acetylase OafA/YrhL
MTRPSDNRLPYMPGIDGLRAIAVLAVFFYHVGAGWLPGGYLGVDVFFVISGYLITSLLLSEYRTRGGHIKVIQFWLRRARRLLPAVVVMIAVTLIVAALLVPDRIDSLRGDALASLFYVNNWHLILSDQSYFATFEPSLFRHLWSLSVEEQFYLLWPLFFAAGITLLGRKRLLWGVLAGVAASTLLMWILFDPNGGTDRDFYGTDTRAVGLLIGVALAMVWHPNDIRARPAGRLAGWMLDAAAIVALLLIVRDFAGLHDYQSSLYQGGFLLLAVFTGVLVAALAHPSAAIGRAIGCAPLVWLGLRSYSFYLWHWPILMLTRPHIDVPLSGPFLVILQLGATLLLADVSYRYVEQVFRQRRDSPTAPRWLGIGRPALAAGVLLAVIVVGWSGIVPTDGGSPSAEAHQARVVVSGDPNSPAGERPATTSGEATTSDGESSGSGDQPSSNAAVLALGDSVMRGAATQLVDDLGKHAVVDAEEGRQPTSFPDLIEAYRDEGKLPDHVVIQMGNNGPVYWDNLMELKDALAGVGHVYLVNVEVTRSWEGEVNSELGQAVASWPEAQVIDWHGTVQADMTYDGVHVDADGAVIYADLIADAIEERG